MQDLGTLESWKVEKLGVRNLGLGEVEEFGVSGLCILRWGVNWRNWEEVGGSGSLGT